MLRQPALLDQAQIRRNRIYLPNAGSEFLIQLEDDIRTPISAISNERPISVATALSLRRKKVELAAPAEARYFAWFSQSTDQIGNGIIRTRAKGQTRDENQHFRRQSSASSCESIFPVLRCTIVISCPRLPTPAISKPCSGSPQHKFQHARTPPTN